MVDLDDSGMPVQECSMVISPIFMQQGNNVWLMGLADSSIQCVISCGSESDGLVFIYLIMIDDNLVVILISEVVFIPIIWGTLDVC